ncbi:MAG: hypothetical protein ACFFD4_35375 [Candidatus Odinarchaeota archaeon]
MSSYNCKTRTRSVSLPHIVVDYETIASTAREILMNWVTNEEYVTGKTPLLRLLGVRLTNFSEEKLVMNPLSVYFQ